MKIPPLAQIRKAAVVLVGVLSMVITSGLISNTQVLVWVNVGIAVLTQIVHYNVRNARVAAPAAPLK